MCVHVCFQIELPHVLRPILVWWVINAEWIWLIWNLDEGFFLLECQNTTQLYCKEQAYQIANIYSGSFSFRINCSLEKSDEIISRQDSNVLDALVHGRSVQCVLSGYSGISKIYSLWSIEYWMKILNSIANCFGIRNFYFWNLIC